MALDLWPQLKAEWKRDSGRRWKHFEPKFRLLRPPLSTANAPNQSALGPCRITVQSIDPELERARAFTLFRQALPPNVAAAIERFPSRQWRLLRLCNFREEAADLLTQNPALGLFLAHHETIRQPTAKILSTAASVSKLRQRDIAVWLGFPDSEAVVKALAKIPVFSVDLAAADWLKVGFGDDELLKLTAQLPCLHAGVLALLRNLVLRSMLTPKLLAEVSSDAFEPTQPQAVYLLEDLSGILREMHPWAERKSFSTLKRLRSVHREMSLEYADWRQRNPEREPAKLPTAPLPGTNDIVPLQTAAEIVAEGRDQKNCAARYVTWVAGCGGYIYRVLRPERATLAIHRGPGGAWEIQQLKAQENGDVTVETRLMVEGWLRGFAFGV